MSSSGQHPKAVMEAREYAVRSEEFISQRRAEIYGLGAHLDFEDDCASLRLLMQIPSRTNCRGHLEDLLTCVCSRNTSHSMVD